MSVIDNEALVNPRHHYHKIRMDDLTTGIIEHMYRLYGTFGFNCDANPIYHDWDSGESGLKSVLISCRLPSSEVINISIELNG